MLPVGDVSTLDSKAGRADSKAGRGAGPLALKATGTAPPSPRPGAKALLDECIVVASLDHQVAGLFESSDHTNDALLGFLDLALAHRARGADVLTQHVGGAGGEVL